MALDIPQHKIGIICNPLSSHNLSELDAFYDAVEDYPNVHLRELSNIGDIPAILVEFAQRDVELIIINGGDGTVQAVATCLFNENPYGQRAPLLAALPGGKTNLLSEDLGGFEDPVAHFDDLMEWVEQGLMEDRVRAQPFLEMRVTPEAPPVYGIFFGTATIVRAMVFTRNRIYPLGLPNALSHALAILLLALSTILPFIRRISPMRREMVRADFGEQFSQPRGYILVIASTLERLLLGFQLSAGVGEGNVHLTTIDYSLGALYRAVRTLLYGRPDRKLVKGLAQRSVRQLRFLMDCPITLDGEMYDPTPGVPVVLTASSPLHFVRLEP